MPRLTQAAVSKLKEIMADQNLDQSTTYVRMGIRGGGCGGFQHVFNLDEVAGPGDETEEECGLNLVIDRFSLLYLGGTVVDYVEAPDGRSGFRFDGPQHGRCGCESSEL